MGAGRTFGQRMLGLILTDWGDQKETAGGGKSRCIGEKDSGVASVTSVGWTTSRELKNLSFVCVQQQAIPHCAGVTAASLRVVPLLWCVLLLSGCIAGAVPIPVDEHPFFEEEAADLQIGITRKADVIAQLDEPNERYSDGSQFVYTSYVESWKVPWMYVMYEGAVGGGVATLHKRHALLLTFDQDDVLSSREIETTGDDFGDCTRSGYCFGADAGVMRYADATADADAKEFTVSAQQCVVYLHGPGTKKAYRAQLDLTHKVYMFSTKSFIQWTLNPGHYTISIVPADSAYAFDCTAGEIYFVHFESHRSDLATLNLEDPATGQAHITSRKLILLPAQPQ